MWPWKLFVLVSCAACYSPDAPECTLACATDSDCISGQACTTDGFCAASSSTQCVQQQAHVDAATPPPDAHILDAGATVAVHVTVMGGGTVTPSTGTACTSDCTFDVAKGVPMTFTATPSSTHQMFDSWSGVCVAQPAICHVTPDAAITLGAKFGPNGGD